MKKLLGDRIKERRKSKHLTQSKLAELINVDPKYISKIETSNGCPSLDVLENIAGALNVNVDTLFKTEHLKTKEELDKEIIKTLRTLDIKETKIVYSIINAISTI